MRGRDWRHRRGYARRVPLTRLPLHRRSDADRPPRSRPPPSPNRRAPSSTWLLALPPRPPGRQCPQARRAAARMPPRCICCKWSASRSSVRARPVPHVEVSEVAYIASGSAGGGSGVHAERTMSSDSFGWESSPALSSGRTPARCPAAPRRRRCRRFAALTPTCNCTCSIPGSGDVADMSRRRFDLDCALGLDAMNVPTEDSLNHRHQLPSLHRRSWAVCSAGRPSAAPGPLRAASLVLGRSARAM